MLIIFIIVLSCDLYWVCKFNWIFYSSYGLEEIGGKFNRYKNDRVKVFWVEYLG